VRAFVKPLFAAVIFLSLAGAAFAADASSLKPPPGAKVALVVFEDLQCPDCARAYPVVWQAANAHQIPVVLHDFPLPMHNWSFPAAVWARYFDTKSAKVGNQFRDYIYTNQIKINPGNLQQFVQKFGDENKVPVPFANDPEGKLTEKVKADYALGQRIGLEHTPTIFVIGRGSVSTPFVEVVDRDQLNQIIEDMLKKAGTTKTATHKGHKKTG